MSVSSSVPVVTGLSWVISNSLADNGNANHMGNHLSCKLTSYQVEFNFGLYFTIHCGLGLSTVYAEFQ